jgi:7-cyano-7-deazaguanine synthase in queuosine biosynthesis
MTTAFCLRTRSDQAAPPSPVVLLDWFTDTAGSTVQSNSELTAGLIPPANALDLLRLAAAVYCADRVTERPGTWTREMSLTFPVRDATRWTDVSADLGAALEFLSGDEWHLNPIESTEEVPEPTVADPVDAVCLFSGGLDSLTGAIDLLAQAKSVCFVSHYEGGQAPRAQEDLIAQLKERYGDDRVRSRRLFLRPASAAAGQLRRLPNAREGSTRSRSVLFLAAGLAVAAGYGPNVPLFIPENGFIGINVPLTEARSGSFSTRTTHPHFMRAIEDCMVSLGITNPIVNPFRLMTKGEILAKCADIDTLRSLAGRSVSCAHPEAPRYAKRKQGNCGYCFPCLIRRAAMHHVGWDAAADYSFDVLHERSEMTGARGDDMRALIRSLAREQRPTDVLRNGPVPAAEIAAFAAVHRRGRNEILDWIRASEPPPVVKRQLPPS